MKLSKWDKIMLRLSQGGLQETRDKQFAGDSLRFCSARLRHRLLARRIAQKKQRGQFLAVMNLFQRRVC